MNDELKSKYSRIANDPSQLEMFKNDQIDALSTLQQAVDGKIAFDGEIELEYDGPRDTLVYSANTLDPTESFTRRLYKVRSTFGSNAIAFIETANNYFNICVLSMRYSQGPNVFYYYYYYGADLAYNEDAYLTRQISSLVPGTKLYQHKCLFAINSETYGNAKLYYYWNGSRSSAVTNINSINTSFPGRVQIGDGPYAEGISVGLMRGPFKIMFIPKQTVTLGSITYNAGTFYEIAVPDSCTDTVSSM